jgi:hypothetical protein
MGDERRDARPQRGVGCAAWRRLIGVPATGAHVCVSGPFSVHTPKAVE